MASSPASPLMDRFACSSAHPSSWSDGLWNYIDAAERHLICSQFDEAAELSATVLRELSDVRHFSEHLEGIRGCVDVNDMEDMIESAGMVSIQAYSESGRSEKLLIDLENIFGCLAKIPSSLFLTGVCLQISAGLYLDAKLSLDSFLDHWAFTSICAESFLGTGLRTIDAAMHWVDEADIPTNIKQDIREELERVSLSLDQEDSCGLVSHHTVNEGTAKAGACINSSATRPVISEGVEIKDENCFGVQYLKKDNVQALVRTFQFCSPAMELLPGWILSSVNCSTYSSRWQKVLAVFYQRKTFFSGAAMVFLLIALHKQRSKLSRVLAALGKVFMNFSHTIYVSLLDFWQLAFNVQLNPLAAVQPLPSTQNMR